MTTQTNQFDRFDVDISAVYQDAPITSGKLKCSPDLTTDPWDRVSLNLYKIYRFPLIPLKYRKLVWHVLRRVQLDQMWFDRFKGYWSQVLGGRPMWSPQDLYFLRNMYRMRFQNVGLPENATAEDHLIAWQKPEVLYQLLHLVFRESIGNELEVMQLFRKHSRGRPTRLIEYGCATAPVATTFFEFQNCDSFEFHLYDLPTAALHYAAYKFKNKKNVHVHPITSKSGLVPTIPSDVDSIFCITVFEHLNEPLKIAELFFNSLKPGGLLFFDYIKAEADGFDTVQGAEQRSAVLDYMRERFDVLHGKLDNENSMGLTLVRKKL